MKTILVADDDFNQRDLYVELFQSNAFNVVPANDGQDAWEKIQKQKVDLIFTGILMPRMTGFELIEKIRADSETSRLPIIVFSHLGREEDRLKAKQMQVDLMVKGFDGPLKILKTVHSLLDPVEISKPVQFKPEDDDRPGAAMI